MLLAQFETHPGGEIAVNPAKVVMVTPGISKDRAVIKIGKASIIVRGTYQQVVNKIDQMLIRNER